MTNNRESTPPPIRVGSLTVGGGRLALIAGPCVIEADEPTREIARRLQALCQRLEIPFIFKASFDKANRTSLDSFRGVGMEQGLRTLGDIREELSIPVTTDIHEPGQAGPVAEICDLIQIPAFLARQTDLLVAAATTGKAVNVKKGQFMAPADMVHVVEKLRRSGCQDIMLTERGTFFGYGRLVNDFPALVAMRGLGVPVVFDATHSVQQPGGSAGITGGNRDMVAPLARAAVAIGVDTLFLESHPDPDSSPSDAANIFPLADMESLLESLLAIHRALSPAPLQSGGNRPE